MGRRARLAALLAAGLVLVCRPVLGQGAAGTLLPSRVSLMPTREDLDGQLKGARWRLGPLGLNPRFTIGQLGYSTNPLGVEEDPEGDWTLSAGGGVDYIGRLGPLYALGAATGSYTWYAHNVERRQLGWDTNARFYAIVRRLTLEFSGRSAQVTEDLSSEEVRPVTGRSLSGSVRTGLSLTTRLGLTVGFSGSRLRFPESGLNPEELDRVRALERQEWQANGGVQLRLSERMQVGLLYERGKATFVSAGEARDRTNTGLAATVTLVRSRLGINLYGGYRTFEGGAGFPEQKGLNGGASISYDLSHRIAITVTGGRQLQNSLFSDNPYFVETRYGGGIRFTPRRFDISVGGDLGRNSYPVALEQGDGSSSLRRDDVAGVRLTLGIPFIRSTRLQAVATRTYYRSNLERYDRTITQIYTTISLGGLSR